MNTPEDFDLFDEMAEDQADYLAELRAEEEEKDRLAAELREIEKVCSVADQQEEREREEDSNEEFYVIRF